MDKVLEICCYSPTAAKMAQEAGAGRIELCDNPGEGGTTPSYGVLYQVRRNLSIPVFPIIRPRGGHFVFSDDEINIMANDILLCKNIGFEGVVIGLLNENGGIDKENTAKLVQLAWPMEVTFHRAFDRVRDPFEALEAIIEAGCNRILTSGQAPTASLGLDLIIELTKAADKRIIIMPGSGIRANNIRRLALETGLREFHSSAGVQVPAPYYVPVTMQESIIEVGVDPNEIKAMLQGLNEID